MLVGTEKPAWEISQGSHFGSVTLMSSEEQQWCRGDGMQQTTFLSASETASALQAVQLGLLQSGLCRDNKTFTICRTSVSFRIPPIAQKEGRAKEDTSYQGR